MMLSGLLVTLIGASAAARLGGPSPAASPAGAPGPAGAPEGALDGVNGFVDLLPYTPDRMNYQMHKSKCIDFVNAMMDKAGHDATRLIGLMPKCLWSKEECKTLEDDLLGRIPSSAMPGGPAGAPAAALLTKKVTQKSPGSGDAVFAWCDTMYNMAKARFFKKMAEKEERPAPGMEPLPHSVGDVDRDVKIMNKWMEKNAGAGPAPALSKTDKLLHKMHKIENAVKSISGYDHLEAERETAKKMVTSISGADHFSKKDKKDKEDDKDDEKGEKDEKKEDKEDEKEDEKDEKKEK